MVNFSIIDSIEYSNKSFLLRMADQSLISLRVMCNGRHMHLDEETTETEHKTHHVALRFLAGLLVLVTLPVTLIALTVKWWKKEEWQQVILQHLEQKEFDLEMYESKEVSVPEGQEDFKEFIQQELAQAYALDKKLPDPEPHSWRKHGVEIGETNETLANYIEKLDTTPSAWPNHRPLYVQGMGTFNETDLKIMSITADYLRVFHNIPVKLCKNILNIEQLKVQYLEIVQKEREQSLELGESPSECYGMWESYTERLFPRDNGQYNTDVALELMKSVLVPEMEKEAQEKVQAVIFTNEDLYSFSLTNFVFGTASLYEGVGIWSNARFGDPSSSPAAFEKCLLRMMKISAHEFGHMRHLGHCTDYECNIGGYMSLKELDSRPLLYCLQDTAKICYLTQTSLLENQRKVLEFFKNFNKNYELNFDFSREIETLKKRINYLGERENG